MVSIHKLEIVAMHCNHASYACVVHEGIYIYVKEKKTFSYYSKTRLIPSLVLKTYIHVMYVVTVDKMLVQLARCLCLLNVLV